MSISQEGQWKVSNAFPELDLNHNCTWGFIRHLASYVLEELPCSNSNVIAWVCMYIISKAIWITSPVGNINQCYVVMMYSLLWDWSEKNACCKLQENPCKHFAWSESFIYHVVYWCIHVNTFLSCCFFVYLICSTGSRAWLSPHHQIPWNKSCAIA